jgi:hypothetical protein
MFWFEGGSDSDLAPRHTESGQSVTTAGCRRATRARWARTRCRRRRRTRRASAGSARLLAHEVGGTSRGDEDVVVGDLAHIPGVLVVEEGREIHSVGDGPCARERSRRPHLCPRQRQGGVVPSLDRSIPRGKPPTSIESMTVKSVPSKTRTELSKTTLTNARLPSAENTTSWAGPLTGGTCGDGNS